jgi:hypothetical protein
MRFRLLSSKWYDKETFRFGLLIYTIVKTTRIHRYIGLNISFVIEIKTKTGEFTTFCGDLPRAVPRSCFCAGFLKIRNRKNRNPVVSLANRSFAHGIYRLTYK